MIRRALLVFALVVGSLLLATPAQAIGVDCKDAPSAMMPGQGLPGFLDRKPSPLPAAGDPFVAEPTTSIYEQSGYAGLKWYTYDLGCGGDLRDVSAATDTMLGNWLLGFATGMVAAANGLHNVLADSSTFMAPVDRVVDDVTATVKTVIWNPWGAVTLLIVAATLFWQSARGKMSTVAKGAAWAILVTVVMLGLTQYPSRSVSTFDQAITGTIASVNEGAAGVAKVKPTANPAHAQGALLVDKILYAGWLRGVFGDSESSAAKRWGPTLFKASANSWTTAAKTPAEVKTITAAKADAWKAAAAQIQTQDPAAYLSMQGKTSYRLGTGFMTATAAVLVTLFRIVADLFMFAGLIMLRLLVMIFPAVAVLGIMAPMSGVVHRVANAAGASVVNVIGFAVGATIHTTVISALLTRSTGGGMDVLVLIMAGVVTVVAFVLLWPLMSLTGIVGLSPGAGISKLRRVGKFAADHAPDVLPGNIAPVAAAATKVQSPAHESFARPQPSQEKTMPIPEQEPSRASQTTVVATKNEDGWWEVYDPESSRPEPRKAEVTA